MATLVLDSPCVDLDLVVVRWEEADRCPRSNSLVGACDADTSAGGGALEDLWGSSHAETRYLVVVDGKNQDEAEGRLIAWSENPAAGPTPAGNHKPAGKEGGLGSA